MAEAFNNMTFINFVTLQRGFDLPRQNREMGTFPIVASTSIQDYHNEYKVRPPGVVTGRSGSLGSVQYIEVPFWPLNTTLWVKDFKGNNPKFVFYFLQTLKLEQYNSGAGVPTLNRNHLDRLDISIPPLPTQRKIASILSAYDDLIENNLRRIKLLESMAQNLYREWFVKFRFPGHEKVRFIDSPLGKIPAGWEVVNFTEIAEVLSGGTPKTTVKEYWGGSIPFFAPKDTSEFFYVTHTEKTITEIGLKKCNSKLYQKNTVFITARGTVGKVVMPSINMAMNQSCYALRGKQRISQTFLFLATKENVDYLKKNTGGATFDTIVIDTFRRMLVIKPANDIIAEFTQLIQPEMDLIINTLKKNTTLRRTRDLLLPKLISGEVDVSKLDITVPEESVA